MRKQVTGNRFERSPLSQDFPPPRITSPPPALGLSMASSSQDLGQNTEIRMLRAALAEHLEEVEDSQTNYALAESTAHHEELESEAQKEIFLLCRARQVRTTRRIPELEVRIQEHQEKIDRLREEITEHQDDAKDDLTEYQENFTRMELSKLRAGLAEDQAEQAGERIRYALRVMRIKEDALDLAEDSSAQFKKCEDEDHEEMLRELKEAMGEYASTRIEAGTEIRGEVQEAAEAQGSAQESQAEEVVARGTEAGTAHATRIVIPWMVSPGTSERIERHTPGGQQGPGTAMAPRIVTHAAYMSRSTAADPGMTQGRPAQPVQTPGSASSAGWTWQTTVTYAAQYQEQQQAQESAPRITPGQSVYAGFSAQSPNVYTPVIQDTGSANRQILYIQDSYAASTFTAAPGRPIDPAEVRDFMSRNPEAPREGDEDPNLAGRGRAALQGLQHGPHNQDPKNVSKMGRMLNEDELESNVVLVKGFDWNGSIRMVQELFAEFGEIEWIWWIFEKDRDYRGRYLVGQNSIFIKYQDPAALVRGPTSTGRPTVFSLHGARIANKIIEVYRSNRRIRNNVYVEARAPGDPGFCEWQQDLAQSTKFYRTYRKC